MTGREAILSCYVENLANYKVGWMRAADQTVLALEKRVVTHNSRYSVINEESNVWKLKIHSIRESDRGCYICQMNSTPLKKQIGCIDVHCEYFIDLLVFDFIMTVKWDAFLLP